MTDKPKWRVLVGWLVVRPSSTQLGNGAASSIAIQDRRLANRLLT